MRRIGKGKKGRVFYRFLLSFLLILTIPIVISVFLFNLTRTIVDDEANRANELLLTQMNSYLDMVMGDVLQLSFLVSYNTRLTGLLYESLPVDNDEYYRSYLVSNDFRTYLVSSTTVVNFYVYLPNLDMVISPSGTFSAANFKSYQMSRIDKSYDEWVSGFRGVTRRVFRRSNTETSRDIVVDTIEMISPLPAQQQLGIPKGWVVLHIDNSFFDEIFTKTSWTEGSIILVYQDDAGILASSNPDIPYDEFEKAKAEYLDGMESGIVHILDKPYLLFLRDSEKLDWRYISLIPFDIYAERFQLLARYTVAAFVLCLVLGGIFIYWLSVVRYRPVYGLLSMLKPDADGSISLRSDEFRMIADSLEVTLEEDRRLKEEMIESGSVLAQRFLKQLFKGEASWDLASLGKLSDMGVNLAGPFLALVLVDIELDEEAETDVRETCIRDIQGSEAPGTVQVIRDMNGAVGFLVNRESESIEPLYRHLMQEKERIENAYPVYLVVGISAGHPVEGGLKVLYDEARLALEFRLVKGREAPIAYADVRSTDRSYYYPIEIEIKLINTIRTGNAQAASAILQDVYDRNFGNTLLSIEIARCLMFDLISTMIKTINSIMEGTEDAVFWSRIKPITKLMACKSLEQLKVEMEDILEQVCGFVTHGHRSNTERLIGEIVGYIEEHYRDRNLGPDAVADHLERNKAYLSRIFRGETGFGMSTYVKQYRVSRAKELLAENGSTIGEIAANVGFNDSTALIRAFKEIEGITPGQFKESLFT